MPRPGNRYLTLTQVPAQSVTPPSARLGSALSGLASPQSGLGQVGIGSQGAPAYVPGVMPSGPGATVEVPLSQQWETQLRDILSGQGRVPVFMTNGYFGKFMPRGVMGVRNTFINRTPMAPGDVTTVVAGFKIPNNMMLIVTRVNFYANRSAGGGQVAIQPGEEMGNLTFGVLDNGHQVGVQGVMFTPPTGGFTFGVYGNNQVPPASPSNSFQCGTGQILDNGDVYYIQGTHELVFVSSVLPALDYTVTSTGVALEGVLIDMNSLEHRVETP